MSMDMKNDMLHSSDEFWNISSVLVTLMANKGVDSMELSRQTGVPVPTINRLRSNKFSNPTISTLAPIACYLGVSINQLIGGLDTQNNHGEARITSVPLISIEKAGNVLRDTCDQFVTTSANVSSNGFAILAKDVCRILEFPESAVLFFDASLKPRHGDYIVVLLEGHQKPTLRQLLVDGDDIYFKPLPNMLGEIIIGSSQQVIAVMLQAVINYRE